MFFDLNERQQDWADSVFSSMSMEEKIAQLLHPSYSKLPDKDWLELVEKIPVGAIFCSQKSFDEMKRANKAVQDHVKIPVLFSADMENGTNFIKDKGIYFPFQMGLAASSIPGRAYKMGKITAKFSRAAGIHWTFSPVIDLNLNPENPITNIRALGDDPDKIIPLFEEIIRGLQEEDQMAATCKHFPGDGVDNRDQHMLVSVNSLPKDQWFELYGRVWEHAIASGTKAIMCGHISFPDWQDAANDPDEALPATLSKKLMTDLLRNKLGFQKVIVSDAFPMIGFTCRFPEEELAWRNIAAGSDSVLFADPVCDFQHLTDALKSGKLSEERVETSARRMIELKASLNLFEDCFGPEPSQNEYEECTEFAERISDTAVMILRPCRRDQLPIRPDKQKKILTVSLVRNNNMMPFTELETVDEELRKRGFDVDHWNNPDDKRLLEALKIYDRIFINLTVQNHGGMPLRLAGKPALAFWHSFFTHAPEKVVYTSFGSPYVLYDHPYFENCTCMWGCLPACQKSAVKYWCGEIPADGILPVRPHRVKIQKIEL